MYSGCNTTLISLITRFLKSIWPILKQVWILFPLKIPRCSSTDAHQFGSIECHHTVIDCVSSHSVSFKASGCASNFLFVLFVVYFLCCTLLSSLVESAYQTPTNQRDCGIDILYSFLYDVDPQHDLNTSCLSRLSDVYCFPDRNSTSSSTFISSLKANLFTNDIQQLYINAFISVVSTSILCSVIFFVPLSFLYLVYSLVLSFIL